MTEEFELCGSKHYRVEGSPSLLASHSILLVVAVCIQSCPVQQEEKEYPKSQNGINTLLADCNVMQEMWHFHSISAAFNFGVK